MKGKGRGDTFYHLVAIALGLSLFSTAPFSATAGGEWRQAVEPRTWRFPEDHGAHPDYRTEWWYFTGHLRGREGERYGYQLTFFRQGVRPFASDPENPWSLRDVYLAHFALTDMSAGRFRFSERISRAGPGLAGAREGTLDVWVLSWSARMAGDTVTLVAEDDATALRLELTPNKAPALHGPGGLSRKGPSVGQASYYVSLTDLDVRGSIRPPGASRPVEVEGRGWFDHEFGSNQLTAVQAGWDWFSLQMSDRRELMIYLLRRREGGVEPVSSGTLVEADGGVVTLALRDFSLEVLAHWRSPRSGARYPSRWRLRVPSRGIELTIVPLLADQELITGRSTGVTYWEGAVEARGISRGRKVVARGYCEMTGYAPLK